MDNIKKTDSFNLLWAGTTINLMGTEITKLVIPTIAILLLKATTMEVGLLKAAETIAFPLLGLFAGVLADRKSPKKILILTYILQALVILCVPLFYYMNQLSIYILLVIAGLMGVLHVFSNLAYLSLIPKVSKKGNLVDSNSKLNVSQSFAQISGPAIAGLIIKILGNVFSLFFDALSFLISCCFMGAIKINKVSNITTNNSKSIKEDIIEGLKFVLSNKTLRILLIITSFGNLGFSIIQPLFLISAYNKFSLSPDKVGIILAIGSSGLILGAFLNSKVVNLLGIGKTLWFSILTIVIAGSSLVFIKEQYSFYTLSFCWFMICFSIPFYNINQFTLRQLLTPSELQGRMNATMRIAIMGVFPIGSVIGGTIATKISVEFAIIFGAFMYLIGSIILVTSHIFKIKKQPEYTEEKSAVNL